MILSRTTFSLLALLSFTAFSSVAIEKVQASTFMSAPGATVGATVQAVGPTAPPKPDTPSLGSKERDAALQNCLATTPKDENGVPNHEELNACLNKNGLKLKDSSPDSNNPNSDDIFKPGQENAPSSENGETKPLPPTGKAIPNTAE